MWSPARHSPSLAGQLLVLQLGVVAVILAVVGLISVQQATRSFEQTRGAQMRSVAEYLANVPVVRSEIEGSDPARRLAPPVDQALALAGADEVIVATPDGTIVAASDPTLNGSTAELGASDVAEGRGWSGDVESGGRLTVAGHAPVLADDGRLIGLVVAEAAYPTVWERLTLAAPDLVLYLGLGALLGVAGSLLLSRLLKRRTRGLGAAEIATLADHREALLHSIREGVIATGTDGRVTMLNDSACELLGLTPTAVGHPVAELELDPQVAQLLASQQEWVDTVVLVGERVVVFNQRRASSRGQGIGAVATMRDRTELVSLQSQLSTNLSLTDTLRAQTHEFTNQLHTISGLVQLEMYDEVVALIGDLSRRRSDLTDFVAGRVADPSVAALLVAKSSVADEAGVRLVLSPASQLPALDRAASADLATVVGNLVDNAIDACREVAEPTVSICLEWADHEVRVEVRDNGPGVPEGMDEAVFSRGFSTKPEVLGGRGIGLPLVRLICGRRGGSVSLERDGDATVFRVRLPVEVVVA